MGAALNVNNQNITNIDVDSGTVDGTTIGAASAAAGTVTTATATTKVVTPEVEMSGSTLLVDAASGTLDMNATTLDDVNSYFPVTRLQELTDAGRIGSLAPTAYGVYNAYSQIKTTDTDSPKVLQGCRDEGVDIALLVPV